MLGYYNLVVPPPPLLTSSAMDESHSLLPEKQKREKGVEKENVSAHHLVAQHQTENESR